jgi:enoyl-CoA hydratase/carnithine racemase
MSAIPFEAISLDISGPVATLTLRRPEALNAVTAGMLDELIAAAEEIAADASVRVVVLTGAGRAFSAGVDLKALGGRRLDGGKVGDLLDLPARRLIALLAELDAVTIAKINGFCFTGALELALACDIAIAADEAVLGDTHAKWGLRPTWGMSQRLPSVAGLQRARYLSYTASTFTGRQAAEWGIVARACTREELDAVVAEVATSICETSPGSARGYKDLYRAAERLSLPDGLAYEAATDYRIDDTEDRIAAFR